MNNESIKYKKKCKLFNFYPYKRILLLLLLYTLSIIICIKKSVNSVDKKCFNYLINKYLSKNKCQLPLV